MAVQRLPRRRRSRRHRGADRRQRRPRAAARAGRARRDRDHPHPRHPPPPRPRRRAGRGAGAARRRADGRPRRGGGGDGARRSTQTIADGEKLTTGGLEIEAIFTPGHAAGHVAFLVNGTDVFTADVLFKGTVGGTMAPGASGFEDLRASVMRLMELPPETVVHPGHREPTTIGAERDGNPFVRIWRGEAETGEEQVHGLGTPGDAEALGARLRRRQQGLGRLRRRRHRGDRRRLPGRARLTFRCACANLHAPGTSGDFSLARRVLDTCAIGVRAVCHHTALLASDGDPATTGTRT